MGKGRNKNLVELRDQALLRRYYYWTEIKRLRFDDVYQILSEREFFISIDRIRDIICANIDKLEGMNKSSFKTEKAQFISI